MASRDQAGAEIDGAHLRVLPDRRRRGVGAQAPTAPRRPPAGGAGGGGWGGAAPPPRPNKGRAPPLVTWYPSAVPRPAWGLPPPPIMLKRGVLPPPCGPISATAS